MNRHLQYAGWIRGALALALAWALGQSSGSICRAACVEATQSISQALAEAAPGDTIHIQGPRVFQEQLVISKPVRLLGENWPVLDGTGTGTPLLIQCSGVEVRQLVVRNSGRDLNTCDSAILITAPNVTVSQCRIQSDGFGVYVRAANGCRIENNEISGSNEVPSAQRGNGIHLWKTSHNQIIGNTVHDKRDGLYLSYADDNRILSNRVSETRFGIHYMYSHQNQLISNVLTRNAVGATLMFSRQSLVASNQVIGNRRHGLVLKQLDNSRIVNNVVSGQNRGLFVQQAVQNRFEGNVISTNDIGVYLSNCSEQNVFVGNAFVQNTDQVWQPPFETDQGRQGPNRFDEKGRGNYWSDYTGTDRNRDGLGDTPYHETDVFGRIVDGHPEARLLALSPAAGLLRKGEELLPILDTVGVTDRFPLMQPKN